MRGLAIVAALAAAGAPALAQETAVVPRFLDETATAGLNHSYQGEWEFMVGGGLAAFDCSGDGRPELYLAGGTAPAALFVNESPPGGALAFRAQASGAELDRVTGAYPIEIDGDGIMDLVVLRSGEDVVMKGLGQCRFARANEDWGFQGLDLWSTAFAATWEAGQAWPTLAVGTYIDRQEEAFPWGSCTPTQLYRPRGTGPGWAPPLAMTPGFCALSMLFTDWNRSGRPSLRISNDREYYKGGTEQMWHLPPGEAPRPYTAEEGWKPLKIWGMGIASADVTGDGYPDYALTSMADNKLQTLAEGPGKALFKDVAFALGATAHRPYTGGDLRPSTAWAAAFADVNNDARPDLFIAKGNVSAMPDFAQADPNNLLLLQPDGRFAEAGAQAGVASLRQARGALVVDLNDDGQLDIAVVNRNAGAELWRNSGQDTSGGALGHWLQLALHQPGTNPDAIGAWVEVKAGATSQLHEVTLGGSHGSGAQGWLHFGLGAAEAAQVRVTWPDGVQSDWMAVGADGFYTLTRDAPPRRRPPG